MMDQKMEQFHEYIDEYKKQVDSGVIVKAYQGIFQFTRALRNHLKSKYPDYTASGNVEPGTLDYTYFYFTPDSFKKRRLKVAIFFSHDTFTFEICLAGYNKKTAKSYLQFFKENGWNKYQLAETTENTFYLILHTLEENPDFKDLDQLMKNLESGIMEFIDSIELFLTEFD